MEQRSLTTAPKKGEKRQERTSDAVTAHDSDRLGHDSRRSSHTTRAECSDASWAGLVREKERECLTHDSRRGEAHTRLGQRGGERLEERHRDDWASWRERRGHDSETGGREARRETRRRIEDKLTHDSGRLRGGD